jgi:hypothetical protein
MTDDVKIRDARTLSQADYEVAKAGVTGGYVKPSRVGPSALGMSPAQYKAAKAAVLKSIR